MQRRSTLFAALLIILLALLIWENREEGTSLPQTSVESEPEPKPEPEAEAEPNPIADVDGTTAAETDIESVVEEAAGQVLNGADIYETVNTTVDATFQEETAQKETALKQQLDGSIPEQDLSIVIPYSASDPVATPTPKSAGLKKIHRNLKKRSIPLKLGWLLSLA